MEKSKLCFGCKKNLPISLFKTMQNRLQSRCKDCREKRLKTTKEKSICQECGKKAVFNFDTGTNVGIRCVKHKIDGMVNVMSKEYGEKRFRALVKEHGGTVVGEYINKHLKVECKCSQGHVWFVSLPNLRDGHDMCKTCHGFNSPEEWEEKFRKKIGEFGGTIIGKYQGSTKAVECVCPAGHTCKIIPHNLVKYQKIMCRACIGQDPEEAKKNFIKGIEKLGGKVIGKYIWSKLPIDCICKAGHKVKVSPSCIRSGQGMCAICAGTDFDTSKANFLKRISDMGGTVVGEYTGSNNPVDCVCPNGHECHPKPCIIRNGKGMCGKCAQSGLEMRLFQALEHLELNPVYQPVHPSIPTLRYDYSVLYKNITIYFETHGEQHEKFTSLFHKTEEGFLKSRQRDLLKIHVARQNEIKLIIFDHTWGRKPLEDWVEYIVDCMFFRPETIIADSPLHSWVHTESPSKETIDKYTI